MTEERDADAARPAAAVRAGLVAWRGRTVLLPETAGTGTTTLLRACADQGATILADGLVHVDPVTGLVTGDDPAVGPATWVAVDLVAILRFDRSYDGRPWRSLVAPEVAHELIGATIDAATDPSRTRDAAHAVSGAAEGVSGRRGDSPDAARALAARLDELAPADVGDPDDGS